jgi:hypothetical protein
LAKDFDVATLDIDPNILVEVEERSPFATGGTTDELADLCSKELTMLSGPPDELADLVSIELTMVLPEDVLPLPIDVFLVDV